MPASESTCNLTGTSGRHAPGEYVVDLSEFWWYFTADLRKITLWNYPG